MEPISGMISGAIHAPSTIADAEAPSKVRWSEDKTQGSPIAPARDEYIPEEKQEPSGRYWLGKDEDGRPKVYFDDPERVADASGKQDEIPDADNPERGRRADGTEKKEPTNKAESCTGNTDKVDREIEKLKKEKEELESRLNCETDDTKIRELEKKLAQVERALRQKDNDAYRRQHATFS